MIDGVIGFLGAGQMAQALATGWVRSGLVAPDKLCAHDPNETAADKFRDKIGPSAKLAGSGLEAAKLSDVVFLSVKPINADAALRDAAPGLGPEKLVVSIAAGVSLGKLQACVPAGTPVVRVMPNTPSLVGKGASCYSLGEHASLEHGQLVKSLMSAVGSATETPEWQLDGVTGLSGSGPAFVYTVIEAMADGGVRAGLPRALAAELAARTVAGAAEMVLGTGQHPAALRDAVASPGGTTIAGLAELERRGLRAALSEAVFTAAERSAEIARNSQNSQ